MSASTRVWGGGLRGNEELPLHAGELMPGQAAEVDVVAGFAGAERDVGAGTLAGDVGRSCGCLLIGEDDVVFGAFAIDQGNLYALTFGGG